MPKLDIRFGLRVLERETLARALQSLDFCLFVRCKARAVAEGIDQGTAVVDVGSRPKVARLCADRVMLSKFSFVPSTLPGHLWL